MSLDQNDGPEEQDPSESLESPTANALRSGGLGDGGRGLYGIGPGDMNYRNIVILILMDPVIKCAPSRIFVMVHFQWTTK